MRLGALISLALAIALAGCGGGEEDNLGEPPPTAPEQVSPPLEWSDVPKDAKDLALLVTDPDAPGGNFVHWTVYGIDPLAAAMPENELARGGKEGENSAGKSGYAGPCPPDGDDPETPGIERPGRSAPRAQGGSGLGTESPVPEPADPLCPTSNGLSKP